jgi:hypothetical protein
MHWTTLAGTQRTRRTSTGNRRSRTLKNWLTWHWTSGRGTHSPCRRAGLCNRSRWPGRRSFVHRTRSRLRNNHSRSRRLRSCHIGRRRWRTRRSCRRLRCGGSCNCRRWRCRNNGRRSCRTRRRWRSLNCSRRRRRGGLLRDGSNHFIPRSRRWRCRSRRRSRRWRWSCHGRRSHRLCRDRRRCRPNWWRCRRFLLLRDSFQHISRPGDVRQIDLSLDFFFAAQGAGRAGRRRLCFSRAADVGPHFFRFMLLQRTGMGLLLRHSDER